MSMTQDGVTPRRAGVPAPPSKLGYAEAMGYEAEQGKEFSAQCSDLKLTIRRRADDYHCQLEGDPKLWDCGKTPQEAIGQCILAHGKSSALLSLSLPVSQSPSLDARAEVLNRLVSTSRRADSAAEVNTDAVRMLLALACAKGDRMKRVTLLKSGACEDGVNGAAIKAMLEHGWVEAQGSYLVLTLAGNGVACAVVRLAREVGV